MDSNAEYKDRKNKLGSLVLASCPMLVQMCFRYNVYGTVVLYAVKLENDTPVHLRSVKALHSPLQTVLIRLSPSQGPRPQQTAAHYPAVAAVHWSSMRSSAAPRWKTSSRSGCLAFTPTTADSPPAACG